MTSLAIAVRLSTFHNTVGALTIGNTIAAALFGITTSQVYIYYHRAQTDGRLLKSLILVLWVLDAVQQALYTAALYQYSVSGFLNPSALAMATPSSVVGVSGIISGISDLVVRGIFGTRLWKFSGKSSLPLVAVIITLSVLDVAGNVAMTAIACGGVEAWLNFNARLSWIMYGTFGSGALADIVVAVSLTVALYKRRTATFKRTQSLIRTLMLYTINTGTLASIVSLVSLITYATMPDNFIFLAILYLLPKLLLNAVLATLNARSGLRQAYLGGNVSIHLSELTNPDGTRATPKTSQVTEKRDDPTLEDTDHESAGSGYAILKGVHARGSR